VQLLHDTNSVIKNERAGGPLQRGPMVSFVHRNISLQRQERVSIGCSRNSISGDGGSENRFRRIVLDEFQCEVGREGGSLGWSEGEELFYGTNVVVRGLS
jgi:hypothetical protein